jgi:peptidoglycan/xylan/chitin deacetylase (PgdA/CDA1 family)
MEQLCPRHPQKRGRRRCFECRKIFCARCEFRAEHHLFCGPACARTFQLKNRRDRWRNALSHDISPRLAYATIALLLATAAAASIDVAGRLARLEPLPAPILRRGPGRAEITRIEPSGGLLAISGSAPVGQGVVLFSAGRFAGVTPVRDGRFRFDAIAGSGPFRAGLLPLSEEMRPPAGETRADRPAAAADLVRGPASLDGSAKAILVSFDAGSSDKGSLQILDALRARSIRTTIFLTGEFIRRYPEVARRVVLDGHEVGNHTFDHPHLTTIADDGAQHIRPGVTEEFLQRELSTTAEIFEKTTGRKMAPVWRAPFGEENAEIRAWALRAGYSHVSWTHGAGTNLDSLDWVSDVSSPRYQSSTHVVDHLLAAARPGGIILMHLGTDRRDDAVSTELPRLLDTLSSRGYRFATATDFLASRDIRH